MAHIVCHVCVLFGHRFPGKASKLRKLYSEPHRHAGHGAGGEMGLRACTFPILTSLISQMSGTVQPIEVILDINIKKEIADNRKKLAPIVDTLFFVAVYVCHCVVIVMMPNITQKLATTPRK